tara:strand:- start:325 stop:645 length:321 start_codon:yes stop_codon:yes gene_type:complete
MTRTLTPTWEALLPSILEIVEHGDSLENMNFEFAISELRRMAILADAWENHCKTKKQAFCQNPYCEKEATHKAPHDEHYCSECIHEHVYDECDPDPSKSKCNKDGA